MKLWKRCVRYIARVSTVCNITLYSSWTRVDANAPFRFLQIESYEGKSWGFDAVELLKSYKIDV